MHEAPGPDEAQVRSILHARARALARPVQTQDLQAQGPAALEVLEFRLADERYALQTAYVREVHPLRNLTPLPCTPPFVLGIVNLRGYLVTVVNLKRFFDLPEKGLTDLHRIVLVGDGETEFGLLADVSVGVRRVPRSGLQPPLPTLTGIGAHYVLGISADGVVVLDMARILSDPKLLVDERPGEAN